MPRVLDELPRGGRILIVRLRSLGDCVLTTPSLALLKSYRPDLSIHVMVEDRFSGVYEGNPDISAILPPSKRAAARLRPDLALNLHGGSTSAAIVTASLAPHRAGFQHFRFNWVYNLQIPRAQEILGEERTVHTAEHVASAIFWLGVPRQEIPRARLFCSPPVQCGQVVIHPFASAPEKAWPIERFVELALWLKQSGRVPWIIGGPADDLTSFGEFSCLAGAPLDDVKRILAGSSLFIGNDSGPAHMAAAFGIPSVVLFGSSDPVVWAPWRTRHESIGSPKGLALIPLERIQQAVASLSEVKA